MDDAQFPPDADNGKDDRARRTLRLRDAESVASIRRDIFGDGSLLHVLGGSPPVPEATDPPADAAAHGGSPPVALDGSTAVPEDILPPADPAHPPAESETAFLPKAGADETRSNPPADRVAAGRMMAAPLADVPRSLDAIIDSFGAGPIADGVEGRSGPTFLAPLLVSPRSSASGPGDEPSDEPPIPAPVPVQVSAIFNGLEAAADAAREAELDESAHTPATFDLPVRAAPPEQDNAQEAEAQSSAGAAESRGPIDAIPEDGTSAAETMEPPLEAQDERRHLVDEAAPEDGPPAAAGGEISWEGQAGSRQGAEPPVPVPRGFPGFPELPKMPSFPEPAQAAAAPPIPEPPRPPFPEPQRSSFGPAPVPRYPAPLERPPFRDARQAAAFPQIEPPSPQHAPDAAAEVSDEAAARIAAQATATAEALENLNRMLAQYPPEPRVEMPVWATGNAQQRSVRADPAPFPTSPPAPQLPLPMPPEPSRAKGIYLLGFLTGLGLSLMAGVALYFLINTV